MNAKESEEMKNVKWWIFSGPHKISLYLNLQIQGNDIFNSFYDEIERRIDETSKIIAKVHMYH